jgi:hypothetical protein
LSDNLVSNKPHARIPLLFLGAFLALRAKNQGVERSSRSSAPIFFADVAAKKDFRRNPGRMGEQQFCFAKLRPALCAFPA